MTLELEKSKPYSKQKMNDNKVLSVFRRLAKRNCRIMPNCIGSGVGSSAIDIYGLAVDGAVLRDTPRILAAHIRQWLADGRIEPCGNGFKISAAGLSWLRRRLASVDEFHEQHQVISPRIIEFEGARRHALAVETESPLRWLASRKDKSGAALIHPFQLEAGERLRSDYEFAGLTARVTASWNPAAQGAGGGGNGQNEAAALQDNVMAARQRVVRALAAVGPELSGVLVDVCCHFKGLEEAEKAEGWPQRSGKVVLQIALTRLARHYGLVSDEQLTKGLQRKLLHWGAPGYRPDLDSEEAAS
jgi:hypothetical protein